MSWSDYVPTFFNQKSTAQAAMQAFNGAAFALAAVQIAINSSQIWRFGLDLAVHGLTFIALQGNNNDCSRLFAAGANFARLGAIYADATGNGPFGLAETADTILHAANTAFTAMGG